MIFRPWIWPRAFGYSTWHFCRITTSNSLFASSAVRRDISISHCDSCGLESQQYMRNKLRSVRSHATGDSQGPRPVLSRFGAARIAVACREFVGGAVVAASYRRRCRDFARPALRTFDAYWMRVSTIQAIKCVSNMAKKLSDSDMSADNGNLGPISAVCQINSPFGVFCIANS